MLPGVSALGRAAFRLGLAAAGVVLAIALGAGMIRLLPWMLSKDVPLRVSLPFAKALTAVAVETAFLVGLPIGFALAAAQTVDRGEARALAALGVSPLGLVLGALRELGALGAVALLLAVAWDADASMPGRFARQLVDQARVSCAAASEPRTALVPLVGVTWLCFPGYPPRVVGALPGFGERAWFTAATLTPSDDLTSFELSDLRIVTKRTEGAPPLRIHVSSARVSGLSPWGRPAKLSVLRRALVIVASGALLALAAAWVVLSRSKASRLSALAYGGAGALAALSALHALDKSPQPTTAYLLLPLIGLMALSLAVLVEAAVGRLVAGRQR
jgi:hypothetical protein